MTPSLEGSPTKAKEAPSPHEVRLATLDTSPDFNILGNIQLLNNPPKFTAVKNDFKKNLLVNNRLVKILIDTLAKMPVCSEQRSLFLIMLQAFRSFIEYLWETVYFMHKLENINQHKQEAF